MTYDPLPALRTLHVPALFLFGAADRLIPVEQSVSIIRSVLSESHADFTIRVFDGDDHGMHEPSGAVDPRYLDAMRQWLSVKTHASLPNDR